jgi:Ca-activated chloride channel family protein
VVYVGDGAPTVGELGSDSLLAHLVDQPHPIRLYAIAVGADANLDLLSELVHGGGLAMRVEEQDDAATAALDVLAHLSRPVLSRVTVDLGSGIENAFPRVPVDVVRGEVLEVVGRVRDAVPATVTIHGTFEGTDFETQVAVQTAGSDASADLRLRWASERLHQQLREGATREEIAELGTRYGLITPYTSYYVPSARELSQMGGWSQLFLHRPLVGPRGEGTLASAAFAVALGPLSIAGCGLSSSDAPAPMAEPVSVSGAVAPPEEAQAREVAAATAPMVAPTAPMAAPPAPPATTTPTTITTEAEERARGDLDAVLAGGAVTGSAADALAQAQGVGAAAAPTGDGAFYGRGGGGTGEGTIGLGDLGTIGHGSGTGEGQGYGSGGRAPMRRARASASAEPAPLRSHHAAPRPDANRVSGGGGGGYFVPVATQPASQQRAEDHARSRCSDAADLSLDDRRALWAERLRQASWVGGWVDVYRAAQRACEVHDARDRRAFLDALIDRAGSLSEMINVYTYLGDASARGYLRMAVLRRVRTPDDLRVVRGAFGGTFVDWVLVDQVLAHATTPAARLRALRGLLAQQPDSFDLRLRLLEELEVQQRTPELRRLAERMRVDPMADTGVRTAIGELFLRLGDEDEARRTFSEIVEFAPLDELARRRLGDLYRAHGWYEDAYRQYETLATIRPDDTTVLLLLAQAAAGAGRVDEALRLEERVMQTAPPGVIGGIARVAQLWSSVRFAELRQNARASSDDDSLNALTARMRRSGVLRGTGDLRVSLVWEHPDADVALYAAHPGLPYTRPDDLDGELGIEAFDVAEQEAGTYRVEVRRTSTDRVATVHARLVVVWHEGRQDEQVTSQDLTFAPGDYAQAWTITGTTLAAATASAAPPAPASPRGAR